MCAISPGSTKATSSIEAKPSVDEQLGDDLVDVERFHEQLRALGELLLPPLGLLLLGQDVDVPAGELRGEPHVLAAPADGERKLALGHDDLDAVGVLVEHDLGHLGRRQRVDDEARRVRVPLDDVDLLALQLVDDRLHARSRACRRRRPRDRWRNPWR